MLLEELQAIFPEVDMLLDAADDDGLNDLIRLSGPKYSKNHTNLVIDENESRLAIYSSAPGSNESVELSDPMMFEKLVAIITKLHGVKNGR